MKQKPDFQQINQARLEKHSFLITLILLSLLFFFLLQPFWGAIFWACIIGLLFSPLNRRLLLLGNKPKPNLAALLTLLICLIICIVPTLFVLASFFSEGVNLYQRLRSGEFDLGARIEQVQSAFPAVQELMDRLNLDMGDLQNQLSDAAMGATGYIAQNAFVLGQGTLGFFISLALMLYVAFFMLRDGDKLVQMLIRALPLGNEREHLLFAKFAEVVRATVKGNLLVAIIQGSLGGLIFWVLGINGALLWGVVMTLLSLIPVVGAGLIWAPVAIYLFAVGDLTESLILTAFGAGVIGLIDNLLRPILVGRDTKLPDYIVLLSTLGGFALFGINGFVLGPLVAALFIAFWQIFMREFNSPSTDETKEEETS
ncbi:MAG: AI-2E family transporter [Porticoccaceae bacterium]